jgi:eukaryotic-like serine/threonine-protein kinase
MIGGSTVSPDDDPLGPVVESFLDRFRRGERPALTELIARHPELAGRIRELIPALVELEQLGRSTGDSIPSPGHRTGSRESGTEGPIPERLGDYVILGRIGGGGMGVVYEAERESLKSRVALKVMHPRFRADPKYLRRFHVEARLAAGLHHTNIVGVFDYGAQDGVCFYAMQFIRGQPLDHVLADIRRLRDDSTHADGLLVPDAILTIPGADDTLAPSVAVKGLLTGRFASATATGEAAANDPMGACDLVAPEQVICRVGETHQPQESSSAEQPARSELSALGSSSLGGSGELRYFREIARVGAQVADALEYAHRRGVLHRDIKPSNLLLDAMGNVWVTDFGLAKLEEGEDLSQSHEVVGTLRYMAPERFRRTSDRRGDIYSLGAALYELLALRPPFEESDPIRLIDRIRNDPPAPPRQFDRNIPRDLETIALKALAKDPKDRFGTAGELAEELRRFVEGRPIRSRPVSIVERFWRWCKRDPWLAGANVAAALLTTVLAVLAIVSHNQAEALRRERGRSEGAVLDAQWRSVDAYTSQARAVRVSGKPGQRFESLKAVSQAAKLLDGLPPGPETASRRETLRDLAIAALALPDLEPTGRLIIRPPGVIMVAFDSTMDRYALRFRDGRISVRRVADDQEIARFQARGDRDLPVFTFSPDGRYLATIHQPGRALSVWDIERPAVSLLNVEGPVHGGAARFSPDSRWFALVNEKSELLVYDLTTGRLSRHWSLLGRGDLAFRPDGSQIAVLDFESKPAACRILDGETGRLVREFPVQTIPGYITWSPDGTTLAIVGNDQKIVLWDTATGIPRTTLEGVATAGMSVDYHPAGTLLASNGWEGKLRLWDTVLGRPLLSLASGARPEFSQDSRIIIALEDRLTTYQIDPAQEYRTFAHASREAIGYGRPSVRHDGRVLAVGTSRGVVLWDLARGMELTFLPIGEALHLMFEASGDLITSSPIGVQRWPIRLDVGHGDFRIGPPNELQFRAGPCGIAQDRSGRLLAMAGYHFAYVATSERTIPVGPLDDCRGVALSPDGQWLATGTHEGHGAQVWRITDFNKVADLPIDYGTGVDFSPDGKWLMTGSAPCRLWEVGTWREVRQIGDSGGCFSPDGRLLVVQDAARLIRLVETETGHTLARLESPDPCPVWPTFSPDGSRLVVTTNERPAVHVWDLRAIRTHLAGMGLDWDAPAYSDDDPAGLSSPPLPPLRVDYGPMTWHLEELTDPPAVRLERYTAGIARNPRDADAYHHRAHALIDLKRAPEAIDDLTRALHLRPADNHCRAIRGMLYFIVRQNEPAIADLEASLTPKTSLSKIEALASCCNNVAWALANGPEASRDCERAVALGRRAVDLQPGKFIYLNTLGVVLYRAGRYGEAIPILERSLTVNRGEISAYDLVFLAMAHHRLGHRAEARIDFDRALQLLREPHGLNSNSIQELAGFRAEAEAVLADPATAGDLPEDVFAPAP